MRQLDILFLVAMQPLEQHERFIPRHTEGDGIAWTLASFHESTLPRRRRSAEPEDRRGQQHYSYHRADDIGAFCSALSAAPPAPPNTAPEVCRELLRSAQSHVFDHGDYRGRSDPAPRSPEQNPRENRCREQTVSDHHRLQARSISQFLRIPAGEARSSKGCKRTAVSVAAVIRTAGADDFEAVARLYAQLNPDDPPVTGPSFVGVFEEILARDGLDLLLLELDGEVLGSTYLNLIPNLSRGGRTYAVIENVVIAEHRRRAGLGRRLMDATLERAWAAGCYKAMLQTGSRNPNTHAFYRACGFSDDAKTAYVARPLDGGGRQ